MTARHLLATGLALGTATAFADTAAALQRCRQIADVHARVACYDAIPLPVSPPATPVPSAAAVTVVTPPPKSASVPAATRGAAVETARPAASAAAGPADPGFGLPARPAPTAQDALESTIAGPFGGWTAGSRITLANGQVWQIDDGSTGAYPVVDDPKVRITRGLLGSFFLQVDGVVQTPRVKRLK